MKFVYLSVLLLPILSAVILKAFKKRKPLEIFCTASFSAEVLLCLPVFLNPPALLRLFTVGGLTFSLRPDRLGTTFALLFSVLFLLSDIFAGEYLAHDSKPTGFYAAFFLTLASLVGLSLADNMQTYYMFFECLTLTSFSLILHDGREESRKAAIKYLCYSLLGAALVLFGMLGISGLFGNLDFVRGGQAVPEGKEKLALTLSFVTVLGFGCKAGMMPVHDWLPTAHPQAPAPASAVLSGCVTKAGAIGILRVIYYIFGEELLSGTWVQTTLIIMAAVTIFCGSMLAFTEKNLKKRLAYSTVSQVSYALFAMFLMSGAGMRSGLAQLVFHAVTKVCLFLCSGAMLTAFGHERKLVSDYQGMGKKEPILFAVFAIASLSLIGIPPFAGFTGKWAILSAATELSSPAVMAGIAAMCASALLTGLYLLDVIIYAFWPSKDAVLIPDGEIGKNGRAINISLIALAVLIILLSVFADKILALFAAAAGLM